jgi:Cu(I)/Ag(I) efflux system membrane fusion protein
MERLLHLTVLVGVGLFAFTMAGCNSAPTPSKSSTESDHDHAMHDHGGASEMDTMKATLAKLPESDRESAEKQHICPVSGEMLGTMGLPLKVDVEGQTVWICCKGCKQKLLDNPDKFLAKLNKQ